MLLSIVVRVLPLSVNLLLLHPAFATHIHIERYDVKVLRQGASA